MEWMKNVDRFFGVEGVNRNLPGLAQTGARLVAE